MMSKKKLSDIAVITMGQSPSSETYNTNGIGLPFFQGKADFGVIHPSVRVYCDKPQKKAQANDILMSVRAPVGATNIADQSCCIGRGLAAITAMPGVSFHKYVYYFLKYCEKEIEDMGVGSTFKAISRKDLESVQISMFPLDVQMKIADILDRAAALIETRKAQIAKMDLLVISQYAKMFGGNPEDSMWEKVQLVEICKSQNDIKCGPFGTLLYNADYRKEGIPIYGIPQVNSSFEKKPSEFVELEKAQELNAFSLMHGDIVMSRKGNVGTCAIFPKDMEQGIMHSDVLRVRVDREKMNPIFLAEQLHNSQYVQWQIEQVSHGAIMAGTNVTKLKGIVIENPPIDLQNNFASFVHSVDRTKSELQRGMVKLEMLYRSLMQKCFKGETF